MPTKLKTVSVRLDQHAGAQVNKAAQLSRQSQGAFLAHAGVAAAERVLLDWAIGQYLAGEASLSELAWATGVAIEALEQHIGEHHSEEAMEMYLASARRIADVTEDTGFYADAARAAAEAKKSVRSSTASSRDLKKD